MINKLKYKKKSQEIAVIEKNQSNNIDLKEFQISNLPEKWNLQPLGKVARIQGGYAFQSTCAVETGIRWLKIANVGIGKIIWDTVSYLPHLFTDKFEDFVLYEGDVIMAMTRPVINGKLKVAQLQQYDIPSLLNQRVGRLQVDRNLVNQQYLYMLLQSSWVAQAIEQLIFGTDPPNISSKQIESITIPIPPLDEQRKIAEILSSMDEAIASTQAVIDQTRKVKQGLLQQLLTRGIGHTKFKESAIGKIPEQWTVKLLQDLATIQTGLAKGKKIQGDSLKLPYLRVANVQDGYLDLSEIKMIEVALKDIDRYCLKPGDVLLTEGGDLDKLGRGDIWRGQIEVCLHQNHIFAVRPNLNVLLSEFLAAQTGSNYGKEYFLNCGKQTTNLASINSTQLKNFPVILPPIKEQKEIVEVLNSIRSNEVVAVHELESLERLKSGLMQDLLTGRVRVKNTELI
ncbi:restriction modification system DNA specificity domain protein [Nostoc carneum NIES-2107]|nr:restriction modification system DNA specificity domain protein [Nostoc carneum NIES-2107]